MAWTIRIDDYTGGNLRTTHFGEFSTAELAQARLDTSVQQKSAQLSYTLELARDDKYDGYASNNMISLSSITHFHYVRDDNGDWVYTGIVYNTDYPNYSRNDTGVIGDNGNQNEGG